MRLLEIEWALPDQQRVDPYGRLLLYLGSKDKAGSTFVNLSLVRSGFAKAVLYGPNDRYINTMRRAERTPVQPIGGCGGTVLRSARH